MNGRAETERIRFVKGHGTENDFVLIPDPDGRLRLNDGQVRLICDRRAGLGGDGLLRVVATAAVPEVAGYAGDAHWFMDYRNADGSVAQMCGNGIRVFARYLVQAGLQRPGEFAILTRGGVRLVRCAADGDVGVDMGPATLPDLGPLTVLVGGRSRPAIAVTMPNPHAVTFLDHLDEAGSLHRAPLVDPPAAFPDGVNVEFVVVRGPDHIALRVHERGVGETRSCGTGACAAAVAAARRDDRQGPVGYTVDVPGGRLVIDLLPGPGGPSVQMTGPAVLVAEGELLLAGADDNGSPPAGPRGTLEVTTSTTGTA